MMNDDTLIRITIKRRGYDSWTAERYVSTDDVEYLRIAGTTTLYQVLERAFEDAKDLFS